MYLGHVSDVRDLVRCGGDVRERWYRRIFMVNKNALISERLEFLFSKPRS